MSGTKPRQTMTAVMAVMLVIGMAGSAQAQDKVRVAVLDFSNNSTWSWWGDGLGSAAAAELTTQLVKTGRFTVVERAHLTTVLAEQNLGQTGMVTAATAAKIGKILGVQFLMAGAITQFSIERTTAGYRGIGGSLSTAESMLDVRLINTDTAEVMVVAEGKGTKRMGGGYFKGAGAERTFDQGAAQEALRPAVEQVVQRVAAQSSTLASVIPAAPEGQIVSSRDGLYFINRGQSAGVKVGQRFDVFRVVDEIKDVDGRLLDKVIDKVGTIEVTQVLSQSAICKLIAGQAAVKDGVK